ncbi:hypothetical protein [Leucobacter luti]|uniref:hypothetical protein n=1 Tax=Leucobacter luti TaxID=340320 RepID=UPI001C68B22F|nr:hypothetical protein [Leucobacter luti]QYM76009.1 hypothetical protein K1X41_00485 [Leucobacter luti]
MKLDLRWLAAPEAEVAQAIARVRKESRPSWVPTKRQVLVHVNHCLMLWYLCIVWMTLGVRIDTLQDNRIEPRDLRDIVVLSAIFVVWLLGAIWLVRWSARPPSRKALMGEWRQTLTALAHGFTPASRREAPFSSLISPSRGIGYAHPRFVSPAVEFGNMMLRRPGTGEWHYLAVTLPAPMPHLIFEAVAAGKAAGSLPAGIKRSQRLPLEGNFDGAYRLFVPEGYERDALFVVTPDVMAALVDHAHGFHVELVDDRILFFAAAQADFTREGPWRDVERLLTGAVPPILASSARYRDDRLPDQNFSPTVETVRAALENPGQPWLAPPPRIGATGQRLDARDRRIGAWSVVGAVAWTLTLTILYVVPGLFAFAGFMSIVDGK